MCGTPAAGATVGAWAFELRLTFKGSTLNDDAQMRRKIAGERQSATPKREVIIEDCLTFQVTEDTARARSQELPREGQEEIAREGGLPGLTEGSSPASASK